MFDWVVIGISGITCGGKTTLRRNLLEKFPGSEFVSQDDFFYSKFSDRHVMIPELNHQNWECLSAIDWGSMMARIHRVLSMDPPRLLFVEGHIIYNYQPLAELCHVKYFFTLTKSECFRRRSGRVYDPADPEGYFDQCVWPMYCTNKDIVDQMYGGSITYLDGSRCMDAIALEVADDIRNYIFASGDSPHIDNVK